MKQRILLRFGFYSAAILIVTFGFSWLLFGTRLNYRTAELVGYLSLLVALSMIFWGIKAYRDQLLGGSLTFGQGFQAGMLILLIPAVGIFAFTVAFFYLAGDRFFEYMEKEMPPEQLAQYEASKEMFVNPWFQGAVMLGTVLALGLVIVILSSLILKRRPQKAS